VFRTPVHIRDAEAGDADVLVEVWSSRTPDRALIDSAATAVEEATASLARIGADPDQRVLVAVVEEQVVGAVHLVAAPLSPVTTESAVHVLHLQVLDQFRRHGVGRALMEAIVTWSEEKSTSHVIAAATANSRDANRFMARLGLGQLAVVRGASVAALRAKLPLEPPAVARVGARTHRSVGQVLVQRRSQRRSQTRIS
jgi:GNAT superfamily N-acetyltransferase